MLMTEKMTMERAMEVFPTIRKSLNDELDAFHLRKGRQWCLHCEKTFDVKDIMVEFLLYERPKGKISEMYLVCPNQGCDGSPIDWHPENKK